MTRPIDAQDILAALPPEARDEFKQQIKQQGGVEVTFTVSKAGRKRKHRWATAKGHVVAVRFTDEQYAIVSSRAADNDRSPGEYLKWLGTRSHLKPKPNRPDVNGSQAAAPNINRKRTRKEGTQ